MAVYILSCLEPKWRKMSGLFQFHSLFSRWYFFERNAQDKILDLLTYPTMGMGYPQWRQRWAPMYIARVIVWFLGTCASSVEPKKHCGQGFFSFTEALQCAACESPHWSDCVYAGLCLLGSRLMFSVVHYRSVKQNLRVTTVTWEHETRNHICIY